METPDSTHNPNRCRHKKGIAFLLHSALALVELSSSEICVAVALSFFLMYTISRLDGQLRNERILENSSRQISVVVLYWSGAWHIGSAAVAATSIIILDDV